MNYEILNEQEWLALLTEMANADNVIKKRLAIKKTPQGDLIFDVRWQTLANFGDTTQYEYVTLTERMR